MKSNDVVLGFSIAFVIMSLCFMSFQVGYLYGIADLANRIQNKIEQKLVEQMEQEAAS